MPDSSQVSFGRISSTNATIANSPASPPPILTGPPEVKGRTVSNVPPSGRKFPCKNCGARLDFDPSEQALKCPYCGHVEEIAPAKGAIQERDYLQALQKLAEASDQGTIKGRSSEVRCPGCGANVLLEDNVATDACPFCATHLENVPRMLAATMICPESMLPFRVPQRNAVTAFNGWIASRWFAPSNLTQLANLGQLSGVYVPFWTYDSMTYTHYTGARGDDYWETETYWERDAQGNSVQRTRDVRRTRWSFVSGQVDHFFNDVLICASKSLPKDDVTRLDPWDLQDLETFRSEFLAGFKTQRYDVLLEQGFAAAQQIMKPQIDALCEGDIGGDHQRLETTKTQHVGVTYKHILLPLWLAVYRYQGKTYRILVNARTGEVTGQRPYSVVKIALAMGLGLVLIAIIALIVAHAQR